MNGSFHALRIGLAVALLSLASYGQAGQSNAADSSRPCGERSLSYSGALYAYDENRREDYEEHRREEYEEHRREQYDEHRRRVASECDAQWSFCANDCGNVQDKNQYNICMVACNNGLNRCMEHR